MRISFSVIIILLFSACSNPTSPVTPTQPQKIFVTKQFYQLKDTVTYIAGQNEFGNISARIQALDLQGCDSITIEWTSEVNYAFPYSFTNGVTVNDSIFVELRTTVTQFYARQTTNIQNYSVTLNQFQITNKDSVIFYFTTIDKRRIPFSYQLNFNPTTSLYNLKIIAWKK